jgi:glycosyltransferase involved in cell wall biosynthesis
MKKTPMVSVVMITYGHEEFIEEAIKGVLMQESEFEIELIIANDCSPDSTDEIIQAVIKDNLNKVLIKYIKHDKNIGIIDNFIFALQQSIGKYIAICDGDDYWTDTYKLQKQVEFLELNEDYNLVGHYCKSTNDSEISKFAKDTFEFKDINQKNIRIPTASIVFRNNIVYPDWIYSVYGGDRAIIFLNAQKGKLKILDFFGSFYRINKGGVEHRLKQDKFKVAIRNIKEEFIYYSILKKEYKVAIIKKRIYRNYFYIAALSIKKIKLITFFKSLYSLMYFILLDKIKY